MSDFNRQEIHQDFEEFFPVQADVEKRSVSIPAAKLLAAIASVAVTAALVFNTYVDCFATQIWQNSAVLNITISNLQEYQDVTWQLAEQDGELVRQGQLDAGKTELLLDNLDPDTKYIITFTTQEEGETKILGDYHFTTGAPSGNGPSGTPAPDGPPTPAVTQPPAPTATPAPSLSPSPSPTATPVVTATPTPVPVLPAVPTAAPTARPSVEPSAEPSVEPSQAPMPEASADTAQLISVTSEPDVGSGIIVEFPFWMNSDNDFINTPIKYIIDYEITDANNSTTPYSEEVEIEDPGTFSAAQMFASIPYGGGVSGSATLVYSTEDLRTGEITVDRQVTSDTFALSEIRFAGNGTVNDLVIDTTARTISGNVTFNVDRGPYASSVAGSQLVGKDIWLTVYRPGQWAPVAQWMVDDTATTSQGENMTVSFENFDISNQMDSFILGTSYRFEFSANGQWGVNGMMGASSTGYARREYQFGQYTAPTAGTPKVVAVRPTSPPVVQIRYPFKLNSYVPVAGDTITVEETGYYLNYDGTVSTEADFSNTRTYVYDPGAETNEIVIDAENNMYVTDTAGYGYNYPEDIVYTANATFTYNGGTETLTSTYELSPYKFLGNQEMSSLNKITIDYDNITSQGTVYTIPYTVTLNDIVKGTGRFDVAEESISIDVGGQVQEGYTVSITDDGVTIVGTAVVDTSLMEQESTILYMTAGAEGVWTQDGFELARSYGRAYTEIRLTSYFVTFKEAVINTALDNHGLTVSDIEIWYDSGYRRVTDYPAGVRFSPGENVEIIVYLEGNVAQLLMVTPADQVDGVASADFTVASPFRIERGNYPAQDGTSYSYFIRFIMPANGVAVTPSVNIEYGT